MRASFLILAAFYLFINLGCCVSKNESQPPRPSKIRGWEESHAWNTISIGQFVLNKGESTDNGKIGVTVVDIIPSKCKTLFSEPSEPRVKLRFYELPDKQILCEDDFAVGGGTNLRSSTICGSNFPIASVSIHAINTKDNWVSFDLRQLAN